MLLSGYVVHTAQGPAVFSLSTQSWEAFWQLPLEDQPLNMSTAASLKYGLTTRLVPSIQDKSLLLSTCVLNRVFSSNHTTGIIGLCQGAKLLAGGPGG